MFMISFDMFMISFDISYCCPINRGIIEKNYKKNDQIYMYSKIRNYNFIISLTLFFLKKNYKFHH